MSCITIRLSRTKIYSHVDFDALPMLGSSFDILSLQETYMGGTQENKAADVDRKFITDGWWAAQAHPVGQQVHHSGSNGYIAKH